MNTMKPIYTAHSERFWTKPVNANCAGRACFDEARGSDNACGCVTKQACIDKACGSDKACGCIIGQTD